MCTDNAAMIAAAGWYRLASDGPSPLDTGAMPNLRLPLRRLAVGGPQPIVTAPSRAVAANSAA